MILAREQTQQQDHGIYRHEKEEQLRERRNDLYVRRDRVKMTGLVFLALITGIVISFYYAQLFVANYQLYSLENQMQSLQKETDNVQREIARLTSLSNIEKIATEELGMVKPEDSDVVKVAVDIDTSEKVNYSPVSLQQENLSTTAKESPESVKEKSWVIKAFTDLVEQVKDRVT